MWLGWEGGASSFAAWGAVWVRGLAPPLAVFAVIGVAQNCEEPCGQIGSFGEGIHAAQGLQESVVDKIVGAIGISAERHREGAQRRDGGHDVRPHAFRTTLVKESLLAVSIHVPAPTSRLRGRYCASVQFIQERQEPIGNGLSQHVVVDFPQFAADIFTHTRLPISIGTAARRWAGSRLRGVLQRPPFILCEPSSLRAANFAWRLRL